VGAAPLTLKRAIMPTPSFGPKTVTPSPLVGVDVTAFGSLEQDPPVLEQLQRAHESGGRAYRSGEVDDPVARAVIAESDARLRDHGHRALARRKVFGIPRLTEGTLVPWPLFPPRFRGMVGGVYIAIVAVFDSCNFAPVPCYREDPLGEFDRPIPMAESVDLEIALGLSGCTYSTFSYHRRHTPGLMLSVTKVAGISLYKTRELVRWIESRGIGPLPPR